MNTAKAEFLEQNRQLLEQMEKMRQELEQSRQARQARSEPARPENAGTFTTPPVNRLGGRNKQP
jgi:hypothetical protein